MQHFFREMEGCQIKTNFDVLRFHEKKLGANSVVKGSFLDSFFKDVEIKNLTRSNSDMVALRAPSGRPKGKTNRKLVK